jgi:tetratricopeptide (TPR) repeat protein
MQQFSRERELWGAPSIKGNLDQVHAGKLLYGFFKARKTGIITFNDGANDIWLFLQDGCLTPYEPGLYSQDDFAWHLVRFGLMGEQEFDVYRKRSRQSGKPLVQLLIDQRLIEPDAARKLAHSFFEKNLIGLFSWRHGAYCFFEKPRLEGAQGPVDPQRTLRWIIDGIRRQYHPAMIESRLEKRLQTPLKPYSGALMPLDDLLVSTDEQQIGEWIRQGRSIAQILAETSLDAKAARALVFALLTVECVKFESKERRRREPAEREPAEWRPGDVLERLYRQAEASVDRIRVEVKREESRPVGERRGGRTPVPPPEEFAALDEAPEIQAGEADDPTHLLRRRIQERIRGLQEVAAKLDSPEGAQALASRLAERLKAAEPPLEAAATLPPVPPPTQAAPLGEMPQFRDLRALDDQQVEQPGDEGPAADLDLGELPPLEEGKGAPGASPLGGAAAAFGEGPGEAYGEDFLRPSEEMAFPADDPPAQIFKLGLAMSEQEQHQSAYRAMTTAVERGYEAPGAKIHLGWAFYNANPDEPDRFSRAAEMIQEGIEQTPKQSLGFLAMGRLYLAESDRGMAELYFVKALELDRDCREARDFIRRLHTER